MTYCIGFKTDMAAFLIADSLISEEPKSQELEELFGRFSTSGRLLESSKYTYTESLQKVREITDGMLVTFATNDVDKTLKALDEIKYFIKAKVPIEKAFITAFESISEIEVLFCYSEKDNPKLFSFNLNQDRRIIEHHCGEIVVIGSGKHHPLLVNNSKKFIENSIKNVPNDPADLLAHVLGGLTSFMNSSELLSLLDYQVGGNLFGGYVDGKTSHMMKDTLYIFYALAKGCLKVQNEISVLNSPSMNIIYSSFGDNDDGMFIGYSNSKETSKENKSKAYEKLIGDYLNGKLEYVVGIDVYNKTYFLCKQIDFPHFKFRSFDNITSKMQVGLPPVVIDEIVKSYKDSNLLSGEYKVIKGTK